jgi:hypothetical protein
VSAALITAIASLIVALISGGIALWNRNELLRHYKLRSGHLTPSLKASRREELNRVTCHPCVS